MKCHTFYYVVITVGHKKAVNLFHYWRDEKWRKNETGEFKSSSSLFSYMNKSISLQKFTWSCSHKKAKFLRLWNKQTKKNWTDVLSVVTGREEELKKKEVMIAKKFSGKVQKKIHWCSTWTTTIFRKRFFKIPFQGWN